ncbi:hypothetical protein OG883_22465 [Streptomyces sp. NBC_01142]|uniref:hypothetical protein n=1 Tax=Streptomyces sp. NBC_01142 TaxID=2975865 RepID=UPI00225A3776|nr:hypothetical protein [Streptomyces sp. NBC_01142]MCX4822611.1 hypothetical protein [Streptomyces sp. NBC_01142]
MSARDIPLPALFAAFGVTTAAGWFAGGRRRGAPAIGAGLLAVQGALHLIFSGGQPDRHHPYQQPHQHQPYEFATTALETDAGMLAAHLLAAAVCALWLARGEAAFFRLARTAGIVALTSLRLPLRQLRLLLLLLTPGRLPDAPPLPAVRHRSPAARFHGVVLAHSLVRRGPPALPVPHATAPGAAV